MPTDEHEHELDAYGLPSAEASSSSHPLLSNGQAPPPPPPARRPRKSSLYHRHPALYQAFKRWWKPLTALTLPFFLLFLYALVHPHVKGLPPLPKVHFSSGSANAPVYEEEFVRSCTCGVTDAGRQLCSVYHEQGLEASRLVQGTGARIRKMLRKARDGEAVKIGVLGGSGESCSGVYVTSVSDGLQYPHATACTRVRIFRREIRRDRAATPRS